MKKIIFFIVVLICSLTQAQKGSQEVSLDLADALIIKSLEVSYEYYLSDNSSVGMSGFYNFEKNSSDFRYNEKSMITPFFRHYFSDNRNWNYFGEIFFGINTGIKEESNKTLTNYTDGALGVSVGSKYISNGGLMLSALAGVGRNMFSNNSPIIVPRVGLNVGYRF